MHPGCAYEAVSPVVEAVLAGARFDEGDDVSHLYGEYPDAPPPRLLRFPDSSTHLRIANDMYRRAGEPPIKALHIFWPSEIPLMAHPRIPDHPPR
jgi:hypothetical protein